MQTGAPHPSQKLSKTDIESILQRMGQICEARGSYFEIAIYGGSALMLCFDYRQSTVDIDFQPVKGSAQEIADIANQATKELGFEQNVLRDDVGVFVSEVAKYIPYGEFPKGNGNLRVLTAAPEYIFAMKIMAMRSSAETQDLRDAWELADICEISNLDQAKETLASFYPEKKLPLRHALILQDVFDAKKQKQSYSAALGW
jgi:Nucleotidyl transferase AbiEii toxin, Type IV TA system